MSVRKCAPNDYYETPPDVFEAYNREFHFELDAAADHSNTKVPGHFFNEESDALKQDWSQYASVVWCNPPFSRMLKDRFIAKAAEQQSKGVTIVMLLPAGVNTKAFHKHIWDSSTHAPRKNVELRFPEGRPRFFWNGKVAPSSGRNSVMVVVFRGLK